MLFKIALKHHALLRTKFSQLSTRYQMEPHTAITDYLWNGTLEGTKLANKCIQNTTLKERKMKQVITVHRFTVKNNMWDQSD